MKPNWQRINSARCREGFYRSQDSDGLNGAFSFKLNGLPIRVIASDGSDPESPIPWEHVSVTIQWSMATPSWSIMCQVKEIFWGDDEWVMQLHPPANENISNHPGCLHLWRPKAERIPIPPSLTVGIKSEGEIVSPFQALRMMAEAHDKTIS